jgi:hypothetical protein
VAPPTWRDPWAWASGLAVAFLLWHARGAPLGEPVLDDLLHLRERLLGRFSLLDGAGVPYYWRPLGRQLYFAAMRPLMFDHLNVVVAIHVVVLAAAAVLIYRALRLSWPGPLAALAASFPLLHESTTMLLSWPSNFQDLGAIFFGAIAIHESAHRRLVPSMIALLAALTCKEIAVTTALLLPFVPARTPRSWRERARWGIAAAIVVGAWGATYFYAIRFAGVLMPRDAPGSERTFSVPWLVRYVWVLRRSLSNVMNLTAPPPWSTWGAVALVAIGTATLLVLAVRRAARTRLARLGPWIALGLVGCFVASATLPDIYPGWAPYRSVPASVGLGIAVAGVTGAAHPALPVAILLVRLVLLEATPGASPVISAVPPPTDVVVNFETLTRLQLANRATRETLTRRFPSLPRGSRVAPHYMPRLTDYAMKGDASILSWYRDTTLHWMPFSDFSADTTLAPVTIVEYQPGMRPPVAIVEPAAMRALLGASDAIARTDIAAALEMLDRAERLQSDPSARVFLGTVTSKRALCLAGSSRAEEAEREAVRAVALWPENPEPRYVIAASLIARGRLAEAEAELDTLLARNPGDPGALRLLERARAPSR